MFFTIEVLFLLKKTTTLVQYNEYSTRTVDSDSMMLKHQCISIHSVEFALMHLELFMG